MAVTIGIRREDKNQWEARTPLVPSDARRLIEEENLRIIVQHSDIRVYSGGEYRDAGCEISEDLSEADLVLGVKEMPDSFFMENKTYCFFSHTLKGQYYNMPMLRKIMDLKCNLLDYERITDENGRRLIFFGRHAGIAGMIDTLWTLGEKLNRNKTQNPFYEMRLTHKYRDLPAAIEDVKLVGRLIREKGVPPSIAPVVFGITGYGNVSKGAQEILDILPVEEIKPSELDKLGKWREVSLNRVYKVVFREKDMVAPRESNHQFDLADYYQHPKKYRSVFHHFLPHLTVLVNGAFWSDKYPRMVTREFTNKMWKKCQKKLQVIGDISCDINGAIEMNTHVTEPGDPVYIFDPVTGDNKNGLAGDGIVILAVDNLPCEIPKESSDYFSGILSEYLPLIAKCDFTKPTDQLDLPPELMRSLEVHNGKLTKNFEYLNEFLKENNQ